MIGRQRGESYTDLPYLDGWLPIDERRWALDFINADGTENYPAFKAEFKRRHPRISNGPVDGFVPATVDEYVRYNEMGIRQDIDWELANIPSTEEEIAERRAAKVALLRERRKTALEQRSGKIDKRETVQPAR